MLNIDDHMDATHFPVCPCFQGPGASEARNKAHIHVVTLEEMVLQYLDSVHVCQQAAPHYLAMLVHRLVHKIAGTQLDAEHRGQLPSAEEQQTLYIARTESLVVDLGTRLDALRARDVRILQGGPELLSNVQ